MFKFDHPFSVVIAGLEREVLHAEGTKQLSIPEVPLLQFSHPRLILRASKKNAVSHPCCWHTRRAGCVWAVWYPASSLTSAGGSD